MTLPPPVAVAAPRPPVPWLAPCGIAIGAIGSACGVGGGIFGVPLLYYVFGYSLPAAVATTLCLVAGTTTAATVVELLHPHGMLFPRVALTLLATALIGAQFGFRLAQRVRARWLKALFCAALLLVAARLLATGGTEAQARAAADFAVGGREMLLVGLLGLAAGVVVPLLGVGGGLVMVPGLLYLLPDLGYLGARSTSLAVASFTSLRSLWLYWPRGLVDRRAGAWLAAGALVGASAANWLVHLPGASRVGQLLLGCILLVAALRFGRDALAGGKAQA